MESCRLSIELCEAVMDALPHCDGFGPRLILMDLMGYFETVYGQRALCACALTCRAWRARAQYLLSTFPHILDDARLALFTMAAQESPITRLTLGDYGPPSEMIDASKASKLFMRSCVRLQHFRCIDVRFDRGPPFRLLRMLPFFATITTLRLWDCTFHSFKGMMDVVWACPNLAVLVIKHAAFRAQPPSAAGIRQMTAAVEYLQACQKLISLYLDMDILPKETWDTASAGLSGLGHMFGCAVTELYFEMSEPLFHKLLGTLLRDSFPALRSVTVFPDLLGIAPAAKNWELPLLHVIAVGRPIPGRLKIVVLQVKHRNETNGCCKELVGTSEKVAGSEKWLPELLSGLAELTIGFSGCEDPEKCARYILSVLPGMCNVLRFQYRAWRRGAWRPYTLPVAK